jgi:hypothetical protein
MGVPSMLRLTRKTEDLVRTRPTLFMNCEEKVTANKHYESTKRELKRRLIWVSVRWKTKNYYESTKRELKRRLIYEYRCDERLKTKNEESSRLADTGQKKREKNNFSFSFFLHFFYQNTARVLLKHGKYLAMCGHVAACAERVHSGRESWICGSIWVSFIQFLCSAPWKNLAWSPG